MANKQLGNSEITAAAALDGTELLHVKQGANSREADIDGIATYIQGLQDETKISMSADQVVSTAALTAILWNTDDRDDGGWHDIVTNTDRVTTGAGVFDAMAKIKLTSIATTSTFGLELSRYNSSAVLQEVVASIQDVADIVAPEATISAMNVRMNAGDFLRISVISSDTTYNVDSAESYFMVRSAELIPRKVAPDSSRVYATTARSYSTAFTAAIFDVVEHNVGGFADLGAQNTRLTADVDGYYSITGQAERLNSSSCAFFKLSIRKNGTTDICQHAGVVATTATTDENRILSSGTIFLSAGDYIELIVSWNPTANSIATQATIWLEMTRVETAGVISNITGRVFQEKIAVSANGNIDLPLTTVNAISYEIHFVCKVSSAGDGDLLQLQVTEDGFSTIKSGASDYAWNEVRDGVSTTSISTDEADIAIRLGTNMGASAIEQFNGILKVTAPHNASFKTAIQFEYQKDSATPAINSESGGGFYMVESDINGIRLTIVDQTGLPVFTGEFYIYANVAP